MITEHTAQQAQVDLARIEAEALAAVNKIRKAVGMQPLEFFPKCTPNDESHCVIASTIPLHPNAVQRHLIAEAWQTKVYSESELPKSDVDYYIHFGHSRAWIKLPVVVTEFRNLFNAGRYPELIAGREV